MGGRARRRRDGRGRRAHLRDRSAQPTQPAGRPGSRLLRGRAVPLGRVGPRREPRGQACGRGRRWSERDPDRAGDRRRGRPRHSRAALTVLGRQQVRLAGHPRPAPAHARRAGVASPASQRDVVVVRVALPDRAAQARPGAPHLGGRAALDYPAHSEGPRQGRRSDAGLPARVQPRAAVTGLVSHARPRGRRRHRRRRHGGDTRWSGHVRRAVGRRRRHRLVHGVHGDRVPGADQDHRTRRGRDPRRVAGRPRGLSRAGHPRLPEPVHELRPEHRVAHEHDRLPARAPGRIYAPGRRAPRRVRRMGRHPGGHPPRVQRRAAGPLRPHRVHRGCPGWYTTEAGKVTQVWAGSHVEYGRRTRAFDSALYVHRGVAHRNRPATTAAAR